MGFRDSSEAAARATDPDLELVRAFASGQADAFDQLYDRHNRFVYNACLGILGDPDDARDAVQETFVQLWKSLPKFSGRSKFSTWLYRIAVNKCMDFLRGKPKWAGELPLDLPSDSGPRSDGLLEQQVRQTVLRLKPEYRAVMVLYYFQQLSYDEIAESLGCSFDQVRIRLYRARQAFRKLYTQGGVGSEV
ncbi:MAG: sigma-70 family RNA polymerase sigma factor [Armatimonadetes bacterium]|nr:sigma-70 family RNA polymerase sigma factor [Armatimonadota bacterium]